MKNISYAQLLILITFALTMTACGGKMAITNVDFAQPFEIVMQSDSNGNVMDQRTGLSFSVSEILENEQISNQDFIGTDVHVIQNNQGYYFVTARGFKHVYVMQVAESSLESVSMIEVSETGLNNPAFNQRKPYIQLIDGSSSYNLTKNGIN